MIRTKKKLGNLIALGLLCIIGVQSGVTVAKANNYGNLPFQFDFSGPGPWKTVPERLKEDDSSAYMSCTWSTEPGVDAYEAYICGYDSDMNRDGITGGPYVFRFGEEKYMINYTYENDYNYEYIKARLCDGGTDGVGSFAGYWSPDSI